MKVLVLFLDAFSDKYLKPEISPFIWRLHQRYFFARIKPLFAYEGIGYTIKTGVSIKTSGVWTDHLLVRGRRNNTRLKALKYALKVVDRISPTDYVNKALRYVLFKIFRERYGTPHLIPPDMVEYFVAIDSKPKHKDIFTILRENGKKGVWIEPRLNILEKYYLYQLPKLISKYHLVILKLNSLDRLGHFYGPYSQVLKNRIKTLDRLVEKTYEKIRQRYRDVVIIIMSDHGMCPVKRVIDLERLLKQLPIEVIRDYFVYIGSTLVQFWFNNDKARRYIINMLESIEDGKILDENDLKELGLAGIDREKYGEVIFALKEGHVFYPDFYYRRKPPRGMHGYAFYQYDSPILIIADDRCCSKLQEKYIEFVNIAPTLLKMFDIPVPEYFEGNPLCLL